MLIGGVNGGGVERTVKKNTSPVGVQLDYTKY